METIFTKEKIFKAYTTCRETKKNTANALKFEINREKNLFKLLRELQDRSYMISRHICFIVTEPKPREIFAADFRDRIVHHLLFNEICQLFEKDFIENSFANRVGKGTHKGVEKLKEYLKQIGNNSNYLKLDIKSFFCSINKDILFKIVSEKIIKADKLDYWKKEILWLCEKIIYHDPTQNYIFKGDKKLKDLIPKEKSLFYSGGKGLPIGNLTSQFFANVYLDQLDKFIYFLGFKYYVRYVDDFIVLGNRKIIYELPMIKKFIKERLDLEISNKKISFQSTKVGIDFLGYYVKPSHTLVRRKIISRFKNKLNGSKNSGIRKILPMINSYFGHFSHSDSYNFKKHFCKSMPSKLKEVLIPGVEYNYLKKRQDMSKLFILLSVILLSVSTFSIVNASGQELSGYIYSENAGWISLNCSNTNSCDAVDYKVVNNDGVASGYGYSQNSGWINFNPNYGGVNIGFDNELSGWAYSEKGDWLKIESVKVVPTNELQNEVVSAKNVISSDNLSEYNIMDLLSNLCSQFLISSECDIINN